MWDTLVNARSLIAEEFDRPMRDVAEQLSILKRGVEQIVPEAEFVKKLERSVRTNRPLRVKYGIDPTGIDVHLGHTVPLRKLRQFQDLGHTAIIIIGNYTALVGDPSGRDETRSKLTQEQVEANAVDYLTQVGRIIDLSRAEVHKNGDWFSKWSFLDVLDLTRRMTIGQMTAREDFAKRIAAEKPVYLHECLYPLMQGWDSVEIKADVELGGTEQLFSLLVARDLQQSQNQEPQVAMTMPILVGTDGTRRMGKSLGNYIGVAESAENQFGKIMSIPDEPMRQYFTLLTELPLADVDRNLAPGVNPRDTKELLGKLIVEYYHGHEAADNAASLFRRRAAGMDPDDIPTVELAAAKLDDQGRIPAFVLLKELNLESSTSNARRLIEQGGLNIGPEREAITDPKALVHIPDGLIVRAGKRKIVRVTVRQ
jgi:tyrosyl-tRNA synthetase